MHPGIPSFGKRTHQNTLIMIYFMSISSKCRVLICLLRFSWCWQHNISFSIWTFLYIFYIGENVLSGLIICSCYIVWFHLCMNLAVQTLCISVFSFNVLLCAAQSTLSNCLLVQFFLLFIYNFSGFTCQSLTICSLYLNVSIFPLDMKHAIIISGIWILV